MDERKWAFRKILKRLFYASLIGFLTLSAYAGIVFYKTKTIKDPTKCFVTSMYKVSLCSTGPNYVRFKNIPKHFFQALILSEDASFYSHKGFDWFEIKESFRRNFLEWKFARGGSTLTQQLAKNLYLTKSKSLDRKFREFFISRQIEKKLSKSQILEKYVNVVEFGKGLFGLKKASSHYFNKSPDMLNILESIYLVSLLPSPKRLGKSFKNRKLSRNNIWRMKVILKRLYRTNRINDELFVYLQMLIEDSDWPFENYSEDMFKTPTIEDQMFEELDNTESDESYFDESGTIDEKTENFESEDSEELIKKSESEEAIKNSETDEVELEEDNIPPKNSNEVELEKESSELKEDGPAKAEEETEISDEKKRNSQSKDQIETVDGGRKDILIETPTEKASAEEP